MKATMYNQEKTLILFSNPFGYGPTGRLVAILEEFCRLWGGKIVCVASGLTKEPHNKQHDRKVKFVAIDQRNLDAVKKLLSSIKQPYVVSSLNRFAIQAAYDLKIPCALIDSLAWFWQSIPDQYYLADYYYCLNIPGVLPKIKAMKNYQAVPAVLSKLPIKERRFKSNKILFYIGGTSTPLSDGLPRAYLKLFAECINNCECKEDISIFAEKETSIFLNKLLDGTRFFADSIPHDEFLKQMICASHYLGTSGTTATLEAFAMEIPTSFLLPINLSQWALVNVLKNKKDCPSKMLWEDYVDNISELEKLNEKDAIRLFSSFAEQILADNSKKEKVISDFCDLVKKIPDTKKQKEFINEVGVDGARVVVEDLVKHWI